MFKTLFSKLAATLVVLFCLVGLLFLIVARSSFESYQDDVIQELSRTLARQLVADHLGMPGPDADMAALRRKFDTLMLVNPSIEIYLLDRAGNVVAFSANPNKVLRQRVDLSPVQEFVRGVSSHPTLGDDPRDPSRKKIFSAAPVTAGGELSGYLYVILRGEQYDTIANQLETPYIVRQSGWALVLGVAAAMAAGFILFALLTAKLRRLTSAVERFREGRFTDKMVFPAASAREGDEVDRLARAFNEMSERIVEQLGQLKKGDALRRDLIANVSHDLRTPLASLRGYIETLLMKEDVLTPQERRNYLEIAAKQSERLGRLITELFELAKLEAKDVELHAESFQLGELAQDVLQKFELTAEKKHVSLKSDTAPDLPFVHADIGLIERVLENLLENALRHTPSGGCVSLGLSPRDRAVTVRVSDTGMGIPREEIPYIFERFYRVDKSRDIASGGAGLGLAIAKRVLDLHHSHINVDSAPGSGTTFSFDLPASAKTGSRDAVYI